MSLPEASQRQKHVKVLNEGKQRFWLQTPGTRIVCLYNRNQISACTYNSSVHPFQRWSIDRMPTLKKLKEDPGTSSVIVELQFL